MQSWHLLGEISLNVSTCIYFIWLIPQLILNFKQQSLSSLSVGMHLLLIFGYWADGIYGFGQHLPWQYRLVTIVGLMALMIEHYQFWRYNRWDIKSRHLFNGITILLLLVFGLSFYLIKFSCSPRFYDFFGVCSWLCWLIFIWPQLFKNFQQRSARGVSMQTVSLALLSGLGDLIAAFTLAWSWPSKAGSLLALFPKFLLWAQCLYYNRYQRANIHG